MTIIRVEPASVRAYGADAQRLFDASAQSLAKLVDDVVGVHYFGPNAVQFKTECGQMAADFASALHLDMAAMATAVRESTSNIAASLGGAPISIQVDARPVTAPMPQATDYVDLDTDALSAMVPVVSAGFEAVKANLATHLTRLTATDWKGNAKDAAVQKVGEFTSKAAARCDEATQQLSKFITTQVENSQLADR